MSITINIDQERMDLIKSELNEMFSMIPDTNHLELIILKGHLGIELRLNKLIESYCFDMKSLKKANLSFGQKLNLAWALMNNKVEKGPLLGTIKKINKLRNDIAHNLDVTTVNEDIEQIFEVSKNIPLCDEVSIGNHFEEKAEKLIFALKKSIMLMFYLQTMHTLINEQNGNE